MRSREPSTHMLEPPPTATVKLHRRQFVAGPEPFRLSEIGCAIN